MTHTPTSPEPPTPDWLLTMRSLTGLTEEPGSGDNPKILAMRDAIARAYPDMQTYCDLYDHDDTPWCGLCAAYCLTDAGIRPVFGPTDTDKWMWAQAFHDLEWGYKLSSPRPGCVVVMEREGGGHVTFYERTEGSYYWCRGGNQSDSVNQAKYAISTVIALMWPKQAGEPPPAPRRTLKQGDTGADVEYVQDALGIPPDGEFGPVTKSGVKGFQAATGLVADGVVGPATWIKVDDLVRRRDMGTDDLDDDLQEEITGLALSHPIQKHSWDDRGRSPSGYISGMGQCFAIALRRYLAGDPGAVEMAQAAGDADDDALAWYDDEFDDIGMDNSRPGPETLRHLFMLMIGLGMRESSGRYCEGRDMSAGNVESDTCEAGLFQTSWNIRSASVNIPDLLEEYWSDPNAFLPIFSEGITPTADNLDVYGGGQGASYQFLAKYSPAFTVLVTAIGLRTRRSHWGPVGGREVELVEEADDFLRKVEAIVREIPIEPPEPVPPEPVEEAVVDIIASSNVSVTVNGMPVTRRG
jgi:uncharacterized protein (TIGR02594 family)